MNTRSRKSKGARLQKFICEKIAKLFNVEFNNQDDNSLIQSRTMGSNGVDVILRGKVYKQFPYSIECKNSESLSLYKAIEQAKSNIEKGRDWMVVHKKNYSDPIVVMSWDAFEKLYKKLLKKDK